MSDDRKRSETAIWWRGLSLSAWINNGNDGNLWFNYEIQRSIFLGKDKPKAEQWDNRKLSINNLEDLCYLKTLIRHSIPKTSDQPYQKNCYVIRKIKEMKGEKEVFTKFELFRKYRDKKDNDAVKETEHLILNIGEIDILRDFVEYCISQIFDIKRTWEKNIKKEILGSVYGDNLDHSENSYNQTTNVASTTGQDQTGNFVGEIDDDIPF